MSALGASGQAPQFTKEVVQVNGVNVTGPPASLTNGDDVFWKMTYRYSPGQPASARIEDLLPPTLQFVAGSWQVPVGWTRKWRTGTNWLTAEPPVVNGIAAEVLFPHITPLGAGQTALIPAPPSSTINTTGFGGDGYRAIPFNGNVYIINHHNYGRYLDCFVVATGTRCTGYPVHVPLTPGAFQTTSNNDNGTPIKPLEFLDRNTGKLYFPILKFDSTTSELGVLCADLIGKASCGFTKIVNNPYGAVTTSTFGSHWGDDQGMGAVGSKIYVQLPNGQIGCVDTAPATPQTCSAAPYTMTSTPLDNFNNDNYVIGKRIFSTWRATPAYRLTCFDTTTDQQCSGWPAQTPDLTGQIAILFPLLDGSGNTLGICARTTSPSTSTSFKCYDRVAAGLLTPPPAYPSWVTTYRGGFFETYGEGQPGTYGSRVFNAEGTVFLQNIGCFDFSTNAACTPGFPVTGTPLRHYATIADPERPGCMWFYGDDGLLGSFDALDGRPCGGKTALDMIVTPAASYCAGGSVSAWDKLSVTGLTLGSGVTATLTIYDGNSPTTLALQSNSTPYAQNLPITSLPILLGAGGLNIGYGTAAGQYKSLRFVLRFSGVTNAPWSQSPPPNAEVSWIGDPLEFCFHTIVAGCEDPVVTNQAKAVTTPIGTPPITSLAPNPPFQATHVLGKDCPAKLTIVKNVAGAPSNYTGTFQFHVTCSTSSGLFQQNVTITWPATTVSIPNLQAGSTCTVSEDPSLPPPPSGESWSGLPLVSPPGGVIVLASNSANQVSFTNTLRACNEKGHVKITKVVQGAPPGFSGTFTFNLACWSGTTLTTSQVQIHYPGTPSVLVGNIPLGSTCTVTEVAPLPPLPAGWFWDSPLYSPPSGVVSLVGTCCPEVVVTNRPKYCCTERPADNNPQ